MESQLDYLSKNIELHTAFKQEIPQAYASQSDFNDKVYADGAVSTKTKRLIAVAIAIEDGCPGCITFQTKNAVEAGASKEEIVESMAVATSMGGTTANAWVWIVVKMLRELGKW